MAGQTKVEELVEEPTVGESRQDCGCGCGGTACASARQEIILVTRQPRQTSQPNTEECECGCECSS